MCVAFVLVLLVLGLGGYAFFKHKPLLNAWFLAVAVVGFLLSVVARIQIRRSEGTRSGMKLATIAWWVTILVGAGYTTYLYATKFVLDRQSEEFTMAWFSNLKNLSDPDPAVQEQNFYEAFWRTLEPNARSYIDPKNKEQMELDYATQLAGFRSSRIVRMFQQSKKDEIQVESNGIANWEQTPTGYQVDRMFQVRCPLGVFDFAVHMPASEGKNYEGRQWKIMPSDPTARAITSFGFVTEGTSKGCEKVR